MGGSLTQVHVGFQESPAAPPHISPRSQREASLDAGVQDDSGGPASADFSHTTGLNASNYVGSWSEWSAKGLPTEPTK
jgi:hypothetical protein